MTRAVGRKAVALLGLLLVAAEPAPTVLHLSASAAVQVAPDLLIAELVAQSTAANPATAQRQVNTLIADGMMAARSVDGVAAQANGYSVGYTDQKRTTWSAQQTLELRAADGPALLDLVGRLQQRGFLTTSLDWQLSPDLRRHAHDQATTEALKELQARAEAAASTLGLKVDHLQDVRLDSGGRQAFPVMAARAPGPQASQTPQDVTADVSADFALRP